MKVKVFIIIFLLFLVAASACDDKTAKESNQKKRPTSVIIPTNQVGDLPSYVDWVAKNGGLEILRNKPMGPDSLEIRIWVQRNTFVANGILIEKNEDKWWGIHKVFDLSDEIKHKKIPLVPKSGFEKTWQSLSAQNILELPDSSELKDYRGYEISHGVQYIIEYSRNGTYRVYTYVNPWGDEHEQSRKVCVIGDILAKEFDVKEFKCDWERRK